MIRKKNLLKKIDNLSEDISKLQAQIYDCRYPNGNLTHSYSPMCGLEYLNYVYVYNDKLVSVNIARTGYGLREYKFLKMNDRTFVATKTMVNEELLEQYYVVDLFKQISVETTNVDSLKDIEWAKVR